MTNCDRIKLQCLEIYITNECNLTCGNCNRYNNYDFSGHLDWRTSEKALMAWGKRITADIITVIGGEPMMHPDLLQWIALIRRAWSSEPIMIQSNGLVSGPNILVSFPHDYNLGLVASLHQHGMEKIIKKKMSILDNRSIIDNTNFTACAITDQGDFFTVHDSVASEAFKACTMSRSHTLIDGVLYKCPMVALLPRFMQQYEVKLTPKQQSLLDDYHALLHNCAHSELEQFLQNENQSIPQCALCPSDGKFSPVTFDPRRKKHPGRKNVQC